MALAVYIQAQRDDTIFGDVLDDLPGQPLDYALHISFRGHLTEQNSTHNGVGIDIPKREPWYHNRSKEALATVQSLLRARLVARSGHGSRMLRGARVPH